MLDPGSLGGILSRCAISRNLGISLSISTRDAGRANAKPPKIVSSLSKSSCGACVQVPVFVRSVHATTAVLGPSLPTLSAGGRSFAEPWGRPPFLRASRLPHVRFGVDGGLGSSARQPGPTGTRISRRGIWCGVRRRPLSFARRSQASASHHTRTSTRDARGDAIKTGTIFEPTSNSHLQVNTCGESNRGPGGTTVSSLTPNKVQAKAAKAAPTTPVTAPPTTFARTGSPAPMAAPWAPANKLPAATFPIPD